MNAKITSTFSVKDLVLWLIALLLVAGIIIGDIKYAQQPVSLKILCSLIVGIIALGVASFTTQGKKAWLALRNARDELRKVVWPTRQETIQSTILITIVVVIAALFLWGIDSLLLWLFSMFTR